MSEDFWSISKTQYMLQMGKGKLKKKKKYKYQAPVSLIDKDGNVTIVSANKYRTLKKKR